MVFTPLGFSWIEKPLLGALARPATREDLGWLRDNGIQILVSLTEDAIYRDWIDDAGLLAVHIPVPDMRAPTLDQFDRCVKTIRRATEKGMGVAVHCAAGKGRTGSMLAAWLISKGMNAEDAMRKVREMRPGSIETDEQEAALEEFARIAASTAEPEPPK